jgi:hypothetical protein
MNKVALLAIAVSLLLIPSIGICESDGWTGNLNVSLGLKYLDSDDWDPLDEQLEFGILLDFRPKKWPFNIAIDYLDSHDSEIRSVFIFSWVTEAEGDTREIDIGIRKIWENFPTVRPYIGGGVAFINGEMYIAGLGTEDDDGTGYWINAGLYWTFKALNLGFDFRYSQADITLFGKDLDAGGFHAAVIFGAHW